MDKQLLDFYFTKLGYKRTYSTNHIAWRKGEYVVTLSLSLRNATITSNGSVLFHTGLPSNAMSIVRWCNLLIRKHKHETENNTQAS